MFPKKQFLFGVLLLLGAGAASFILKSPRYEIVLLCAMLIPFGWRWPLAAFSLLLFFCNFQYLLGLEPGVLFYGAAGLAAVIAVRLRKEIVAQLRDCQATPLLFVAVSFAILNLSHPISSDWKEQVANAVYALMVPAVLLIGRDLAQRERIDLLVVPIVAGAMFAGIVSALFLYGPVRFLSLTRSFDYMRLTGLLEGPNALARLMAPALLITLLLAARRHRILWLSCFAVLAVLQVSTLSKATIGATVVALACGTIIKDVRRVFASAAVALFALALVWPASVGPILQTYAGKRWHVDPVVTNWQKTVDVSDPVERTIRSYRLGYSVPTAGKNPYKLTDNNILHTGRRYATWKGGIDIFLEHPLWGVGPDGWAVNMKEDVGTGFSSPHNGFLEALGSYGILGGVLYLALLGAVIISLRRASRESGDRLVVVGVTLFAVMLFLRELAEPQAMLVTYPYLFWVWTAFGFIDLPAKKLPRLDALAQASG